ncbi:Coatomer subunit beta [Gurleya vavrai]
MQKSLLLQTTTQQNITQLLSINPSLALQNLISLQSQNNDTSEYINNIIKTILQTKPSPKTLKLFYSYIALIPKKDKDGRILGEVLLLTNQIRKDLTAINEYIRGATMQCVLSFLDLPDTIDNFYKPIKDNITHKHSYVRRWASHLLGEIYQLNTEKYSEVKEIIYNSLMIERDSMCARQMLNDLYKIDYEKAVIYKPLINETPIAVLEIIIENAKSEEEINYVKLCLEKVPFYAGLKLLKLNLNNLPFEKIYNLILKSERKKDALKEIVDNEFDVDAIKGNLKLILDIIKNDENLLLHPNLIEFLFEVCQSNEMNLFLDELCFILKNSGVPLKIFLIQKLSVLMSYYSVSNHELIFEIQNCVNHNDPGVSYESLKFLSHQNDVIKIIQLEKIKFGKIFRMALNIVKDKLKDEDEVLKKICLFEDALDLKEKHETRVPILKNLYCDETPFIGCSIALFFESINNKIFLSVDLKGKIIALLLKFIKQGEITKKMDKSSQNIINMCVKSIIKEERKEIINYEHTKKTNFINSFLEPINFSLISNRKKHFKTKTMHSDVENEICRQLSGLSDPIYCEAIIKIMKYDIIIDVVVFNQTNTMFQNLTFDFTTSSNLKLQSNVLSITNLPARTVNKIVFNYKVEECSNSFICGNVKFNCPGDKGQYSGSFYMVNLEEIKFDIKDFLGGVSFINLENAFRDKWTKLEWENTYSAKLAIKKNNNNLTNLRNFICNVLKGKILSEESDDSYLVSNIVCGTLLGDDILINLLMSADDFINLECRVRSGRENIVKSISSLISDGVKGY